MSLQSKFHNRSWITNVLHSAHRIAKVCGRCDDCHRRCTGSDRLPGRMNARSRRCSCSPCRHTRRAASIPPVLAVFLRDSNEPRSGGQEDKFNLRASECPHAGFGNDQNRAQRSRVEIFRTLRQKSVVHDNDVKCGSKTDVRHRPPPPSPRLERR